MEDILRKDLVDLSQLSDSDREIVYRDEQLRMDCLILASRNLDKYKSYEDFTSKIIEQSDSFYDFIKGNVYDL